MLQAHVWLRAPRVRLGVPCDAFGFVPQTRKRRPNGSIVTVADEEAANQETLAALATKTSEWAEKEAHLKLGF